ncbi:MAG: hypothetical protein ABI855_10080 [Bacteroidota bacterium]
MAKSSKRPLAVLSLKKINRIGDFMLFVRTLLLNILNHPLFFVTPVPVPATVTTDVDKLDEAQTIAKTRVTGSASARDLKYDIVLTEVYGLQSYVQGLADIAPDEATAIAIINASGFGLKNRGVRVKPPLAARQGSIGGSIDLIAKSAGKRVSYEWQSSSDTITWTDLPVTLQAKTKVTGLTSGTRIYFRFRAILKDGVTSWSAFVSIIVL